LRAGGDLAVAHARPSGLAVTVRLPSLSPPGSSAPRRDAVPGGRSRSPSAG
jgi:hypothetical protein